MMPTSRSGYVERQLHLHLGSCFKGEGAGLHLKVGAGTTMKGQDPHYVGVVVVPGAALLGGQVVVNMQRLDPHHSSGAKRRAAKRAERLRHPPPM